MKKLFAIILAVAMLASMAVIVSAAEATKTATTTLTTTVQPASYELNIPQDMQQIDFGVTYKDIGPVTITNATGFAIGKNVKVTVSYTEFTSESVATTIPFTLSLSNKEIAANTLVPSGSSILFKGQSSGGVAEYNKQDGTSSTSGFKSWDMDQLIVEIKNNDWGKALAGDYTATITFTAEVVVED